MNTRTIFTRVFWLDALERAIKTAAQTTIIGLAMSDVGPVNAFELDYGLGAGFAAGGFILSALTSIGTAQATGQPNASAVQAPPPAQG